MKEMNQKGGAIISGGDSTFFITPMTLLNEFYFWEKFQNMDIANLLHLTGVA